MLIALLLFYLVIILLYLPTIIAGILSLIDIINQQKSYFSILVGALLSIMAYITLHFGGMEFEHFYEFKDEALFIQFSSFYLMIAKVLFIVIGGFLYLFIVFFRQSLPQTANQIINNIGFGYMVMLTVFCFIPQDYLIIAFDNLAIDKMVLQIFDWMHGINNPQTYVEFERYLTTTTHYNFGLFLKTNIFYLFNSIPAIAVGWVAYLSGFKKSD
ncbi:MAG: hypothetical protein Q4B88_04890 [Moraxella sp.]|nr:hypothetical protein [Moraxella sp.]